MPTEDTSPRVGPHGHTVDEIELGRRVAAAVISAQQDEPLEKTYRELELGDVGPEWIAVAKELKEGMIARVVMNLRDSPYRIYR